MIGASGRGTMAGYEASRRYSPDLPNEEIASIARKILVSLRERGFAHLDPEQDFVRSFVESFRLAFAEGTNQAKLNE